MLNKKYIVHENHVYHLSINGHVFEVRIMVQKTIELSKIQHKKWNFIDRMKMSWKIKMYLYWHIYKTNEGDDFNELFWNYRDSQKQNQIL